jgi:alpha/beta superfamily hydrolase
MMTNDPFATYLPMTAAPTNPVSFPLETGELQLVGGAGLIEAQVEVPADGEARAGVAIVCHPHPLHEGTMHNKVVTMLSRTLRELGLAVVRFNFRGVGESAGTYDGGKGEAEDVEAIARWLEAVRPGDALWLAGFSFGSYVAARAAQRLPVQQLVSVGPAVENFDFASLRRPDCPWVVIQGEEDEVVKPEAVFDWAASVKPPVQLIRMPETGHFFHRRLMDLRGALKNAVKTNLPPLRGDG